MRVLAGSRDQPVGGPQFPWATLAINVSGSFAIGMLAVLLSRWLPHPHIRLLVIVGFLGGYTTFSSFSAEALGLWERGERPQALAYVVGSVVAGLVAVVLGTALGRGLIEATGRWSTSRERAAAVGEPGRDSSQDGPGGRRQAERTKSDRGGKSETAP